MHEWKCVLLCAIASSAIAGCAAVSTPSGTRPSPTPVASKLPPTLSVVPSTEVVATATLIPGTPALVTATGLPPTPAAYGAVPFWGFHMFGSLNGWAWGWPEGLHAHLWHTNDGGLTWTDVSPRTMQLASQVGYGSYLDPVNAWVSVCGLPAQRCGLARTSDGGMTWTVVNDTVWRISDYWIRFFSERDGLMYTAGAAAGKGIWYFMETHDSGVTWTPLQVASSPGGLDTPEPGEFITCNICGDALYVDPDRLVIVHGSNTGDPEHEILLSITTNRGRDWHTQKLPLPSGPFSRSWLDPQPPVFYDDRDGLLPVALITEDRSQSAMAFYVTSDGGLSWMFQSLVANAGKAISTSHLVVVSRQDSYLRCGDDLCVTNDGAATWQTLPSNLNFSYSETQPYVRFFDFGEPTTGWALVGLPEGEPTLWRTTDGGKAWSELAPVVSH